MTGHRSRASALLGIAALAALGLGAASSPAGGRGDEVPDALTRARALAEAKDWNGVVAQLTEPIQRAASDGPTLEVYGQALLQLGRNDEAAHFLDLAARRFALDLKDDRARACIALLRRADPLSHRRDAFFKKLVDTLCDSAEDLEQGGHPERALAILERLPAAAAPGKDAQRVETLLEKARAAFKTVSLDESAPKASAPGERPLVVDESEHYRFACHLEPEVVKRLGTVMDDIHAFYVQVYFDGDAKKARAEKPTIRVHPDKKSMLAGWGGGSAPEGWWSPGTNEVVTFDTRSKSSDGTGTLDDMLVTLFHEASHQFMTLLSRGGYTPAWLNEGTASFFEGTTAMADGRVLWPGPALGRLRNLADDLRGARPLGADKVVSYADAGSYGPEYYAWGWGLVYFLQQWEDPATLEYAYRPLYAEYRTRVIEKGGEPMKVFEETFLGKRSPRRHQTFAEFEAEWRGWILREVEPLCATTPKARELHLKRVAEYLNAAQIVKARAADKKGDVDESELLRRALGHIEYVRSKIDAETAADGELIVQQAEILERLKRPAAAAPLYESALDLADQGRFAVDEKRYAELEKRLQRIDRKNAALRSARSRTQNLARTATLILGDYRASKEPELLLRAYSFSALAAAVLADDRALALAAEALRAEARDRRLLLGQIRALDAPKARWKTAFHSPPRYFEVDRGEIALDCVRSAGFLDADVVVTGEYEVRARVTRARGADPGSAAGIVAAGRADDDWVLVGIDERGTIGIWQLELTSKDSTSLKRLVTLFPKPALDVTQPLDLVVHVTRDGRMIIRAGASSPVEGRVPLDPGIARHVGVFAKNTLATFQDALVEIYP